MKENNFTKNKLSYDNLDNFYIRKVIFEAIKSNLPKFKGRLLDVGCGKMPYREYIIENSKITEYIGLDIDNAIIYDSNIRPDITWDGKSIPCENDSFETVFSTEVLEHCPDPMVFLSEVYRVIEFGGLFFFTVPFIWPLHESPNDEFRYTPFSLERMLKECGFEDVEIYSGGGWHASMAQMLGLWSKRAPLRSWQRKVIIFLSRPIISFLIKKDRKIDHSIKDQQMFTNFYGTAKKRKE